MARRPTPNLTLALRSNPAGQALILTTLVLLGIGVVMVHSALASVASVPARWYQRVDMRNTVFAGVAALVFLLSWRLDYRKLNWGKRLPWIPLVGLVLAVGCAALVYVPGIGKEINGARRWLRATVAGVSIGFQPSELVKLTLVVFLSAWLSRDSTNKKDFLRTFLPASLSAAVCVGVVIKEDFGTGVIIGAVACVAMWMARVPLLYLMSYLPPAAAGFYFLVYRSPHRWARIMAMLDPWSQDNHSSYQAGQSLIALAKGGWLGCGLGNGTRKLGFLPEDSTDFIFAVFCEEWGFVGAATLMGLLLVWIFCARSAAAKAGDRFGAVLAGSLGFLIALQAVLHVAVVLCVLPPTGIQFPFISAGGTLLIMMAGATALIVSVSARPDPDSLQVD